MTLKPGTFRAKGVSAALGYTKGDREQVAVELRVLEEDFLGEQITWYGYFTEQTTERTLESLRLLGWVGDDLFDLSGIGSTEVRIVVEEEEYDGKWSLKVKWINSLGGLGLAKPMNETQGRAFAARMKGSILAHAKKAGGGAGTSSAARPAPSSQQRQPSSRGSQQRHDGPPPHTDADDPLPF